MEQPKIERVLRLMMLMTGNVSYSVEDLAERLHTSPRSVYRYIETFKEAGFVVQKLANGGYRLGRESKYFKDISQLIHFTDEEAHIVNRLIDALDDTNLLKQNLRRKLTSVYDCTSLADCIVRGKNAVNVNRIIEAIQSKRGVVLRNYASSHTGIVRDRRVEPFGFTTNYVQIWCYEPESGLNKLFNTARIDSVDILDGWQFADRHREGYTDVFRYTGFEQMRVRLRMGVLARNLLVEEYPLAERDLHREDESHWLLDTLVCNYTGVGRFVTGLSEDVEIVDSPMFAEHIRGQVKKLNEKFGH